MGEVSFAGAARANMSTFFTTIGHSTRTLGEFIDLLRELSVDLVVDVRSMPRSRTNPQFNLETLPEGLAPWRIGYNHVTELGGLRGKQRLAEPSPNAFWRVRGFRNYADYAVTAPFALGLARLREQVVNAIAQSCARKPSGGAATGASSPTISSPPASTCVTFSDRAHIEEARLTPRRYRARQRNGRLSRRRTAAGMM